MRVIKLSTCLLFRSGLFTKHTTWFRNCVLLKQFQFNSLLLPSSNKEQQEQQSIFSGAMNHTCCCVWFANSCCCFFNKQKDLSVRTRNKNRKPTFPSWNWGRNTRNLCLIWDRNRYENNNDVNSTLGFVSLPLFLATWRFLLEQQPPLLISYDSTCFLFQRAHARN